MRTLEYRPWKGNLRTRFLRFWPIARTGISLVLRRRIFWVFLLLGLLNFLLHFARIYITSVQIRLAAEDQQVPQFLRRLAEGLAFEETGRSYRDFIFGQNIVLMMMLAFAGSILVGNDFRFHSVAFYLSRPITRIDYFLGKLAAAFSLAAMLTLVPALVLYIEYGAFTESLDYWRDNTRTLVAIIVYGTLVSLTSATVLLGVASLFKRTIPIMVIWGGIFIFLPLVGRLLRDVFRRPGHDPWGWDLVNFWSGLRWVANVLFEIRAHRYAERWPWVVLVLAGWVSVSVLIFWWRIRDSEVAR